MARGIALMAFGHPAYGKLSFNLVLSLKYHNSKLPVQLIYEEKAISQLSDKHLSFFDILTPIRAEDLYDDINTKRPKLNPGKAKTRIYDYLAFEENVYLDSDAVALKDLGNLFESCAEGGQYYYSQTVGRHRLADGRDFKEMQWAWVDDIWAHYALHEEAVLPATNSSFAYIRKSEEAKQLFHRIQQNIDEGLPLNKLRMKWGGSFPDELALNVALAQQSIDPDPGFQPVYFSMRLVKDFKEVTDNYYVLGLFGGVGFTHQSLTAWYDRLIQKYSVELLGRNAEFKSHLLMRHKHANGR